MFLYQKNNVFIFKIIILYIFINSINGKDTCNLNTFSISENYFNEQVVALYLSSLELNTGSSNLLLFNYQIASEQPQSCYNNQLVELFLNFKISIYSPQLGFSNYETFLDSRFKLSSIINDIQFKNTDMGYIVNSMYGAELEKISYSLGNNSSDKEIETIISLIAQSGKMPNGSYNFEITITSDDPADIIDVATKQINVYEPLYINAISPGSILSDTLNSLVYNTYPVFNFEVDHCSSENCILGIRICEYNPSIHTNLYEAMDSNSVLPINQNEDYHILDNFINSFQYPLIDAEKLKEGKYYAWQLKQEYISTFGKESLYSNVLVFKIHSFKKNVSTNEDNMKLLKAIIGAENYRAFFESSGDLSSYTTDFSYVTIDNKEVSISSLYDLLEKIESKQIKIIGIDYK